MGNQMRNMQFALAIALIGVSHALFLPATYQNTCSHLVNGSLTCCNKDADCAGCDAEYCACWACGQDGTDVIDGRSYNCDSCAAPPPTPPHTYSNICQHLVNDTLACCNTNADCGEEGGACWACPDGSSWVDHRYFKCDTCQALTPTPPAPPAPPAPGPAPAPPTPAPNCDWASEVLSCTVDATCSGWVASQCASSQAVSSYCRLDNHVCHFSGN